MCKRICKPVLKPPHQPPNMSIYHKECGHVSMSPSLIPWLFFVIATFQHLPGFYVTSVANSALIPKFCPSMVMLVLSKPPTDPFLLSPVNPPNHNGYNKMTVILNY